MTLRADAAMFILGYLWWILEPLLFVAIFYLVFGFILGSPRADFLTFLVVGKLPFQWFSGGVNTAASSIVGGQALIAQAHIPKSLLVLSRVQQSTYKQLAIFALMFVYVLAQGVEVTRYWWWLPIIALIQYLLIAAISIIGAVMVCWARDFTKVIQLFTIAMMFASGIFWDVRALSPDAQWWILTLNPLAFLLDAYRQVMLYGSAVDYVHLLTLGVVCSVVLIVVIAWTRRVETWLAMQVLS